MRTLRQFCEADETDSPITPVVVMILEASAVQDIVNRDCEGFFGKDYCNWLNQMIPAIRKILARPKGSYCLR